MESISHYKNRANVVFSIEIELGWGFHDLPNHNKIARQAFSDNRRIETQKLKKLLKLCDELDIPISFDIVGHLLLTECDGKHYSPHSEDWFNSDPGGNYKTDPLYYAPDIVNLIKNASVEHEIATHTFSHINCSRSTKEVFLWELEKVNQVHEDSGIAPPVSLVPPRHYPPDIGFCTTSDITVIRMPISSRRPESKIGTFVEILTPDKPVKKTDVENEIIKTYSTRHTSLTARSLPMGQRHPHWTLKSIPQVLRQKVHKRYLRESVRQAVASGTTAHFNTHLHDLANEVQTELIEDFFRWLDSYQDSHPVSIVTMRGLMKDYE